MRKSFIRLVLNAQQLLRDKWKMISGGCNTLLTRCRLYHTSLFVVIVLLFASLRCFESHAITAPISYSFLFSLQADERQMTQRQLEIRCKLESNFLLILLKHNINLYDYALRPSFTSICMMT